MEAILQLLATLTSWALEIYLWIIIAAILLTWVQPDPNNPIIRFLNRMTVPFWNWLARWLPRSLKLFSAYISLLVVWFLQVFVPGALVSIGAFSGGRINALELPTRVVGFFLLGLGVVLQNLLFLLIILLVIWFVLTLVNPSVNNILVRTIFFLVDPFITPLQRRLPRMRVDISPLVAAGIFLLVNVLVVSELMRFAASLTRGGLAALPHGVL